MMTVISNSYHVFIFLTLYIKGQAQKICLVIILIIIWKKNDLRALQMHYKVIFGGVTIIFAAVVSSESS